MEHVVFFTGADGVSHFRRTPTLDDAVRAVEHLRNAEGVDDSRVFALSEVALSFKAYYRVELPGDEAVAEAPASEPVSEPVAEAVSEPVAEVPAEPVAEQWVAEAVEEPVPATVAATSDGDFSAETPDEPPAKNGRGNAPRGMGFFAR